MVVNTLVHNSLESLIIFLFYFLIRIDFKSKLYLRILFPTKLTDQQQKS